MECKKGEGNPLIPMQRSAHITDSKSFTSKRLESPVAINSTTLKLCHPLCCVQIFDSKEVAL